LNYQIHLKLLLKQLQDFSFLLMELSMAFLYSQTIEIRPSIQGSIATTTYQIINAMSKRKK